MHNNVSLLGDFVKSRHVVHHTEDLWESCHVMDRRLVANSSLAPHLQIKIYFIDQNYRTASAMYAIFCMAPGHLMGVLGKVNRAFPP